MLISGQAKNKLAINNKEQSHAQANKSETKMSNPSTSHNANTNQQKNENQPKKHS